MDCKERFNKEFKIATMSRNSLRCIDTQGNIVYIHRNAYNQLHDAVDYRIIKKPEMDNMQWIEVLVWKSF